MDEIKHKCEDLLKMYSELQDLLDGQLRDYNGVTLYPAEIHLLARIDENEELNMTELAAKQNITKGALSKTVSKLIKKGLLDKFQQEGNSKNIYLRLTEQGKNACAGHQAFHLRHAARLSPELTAFAEEHQAILLQALVYAEENLRMYLKEMQTEDL